MNFKKEGNLPSFYLFIFRFRDVPPRPAYAPRMENTTISERKISAVKNGREADISFGKNKLINIYRSIKSPPEKSPERSEPLPIFLIQKSPERKAEK